MVDFDGFHVGKLIPVPWMVWLVYSISKTRLPTMFLRLPNGPGPEPCWAFETRGSNIDALLIEEIRRSPAEVGSISHYLQGLYIPGGCLGFLPSIVPPKMKVWKTHSMYVWYMFT